MTITPHLVHPVTFLLNVVQPDYLEKAGLANKCSLDFLSAIDTIFAKVSNSLFNLHMDFFKYLLSLIQLCASRRSGA